MGFIRIAARRGLDEYQRRYGPIVKYDCACLVRVVNNITCTDVIGVVSSSAFQDIPGVIVCKIVPGAIEMVIAIHTSQGIATLTAIEMVGVVALAAGNGILAPTAIYGMYVIQGGAGEIYNVPITRSGNDILPSLAVDLFDGINGVVKIMQTDYILDSALVTAQDFVMFATAVEGVVVGVFTLDGEGIYTGSAVHDVKAQAAFYVVVAAMAFDGIIAAHAVQVIVFGPAGNIRISFV